MSIKILVSPCSDHSELTLNKLDLYHSGCEPVKLMLSRDQINDKYMLRCSCGFELDFPSLGDTPRIIIKCAIDLQPAALPAGSYPSNQNVTIEIISTEKA